MAKKNFKVIEMILAGCGVAVVGIYGLSMYKMNKEYNKSVEEGINTMHRYVESLKEANKNN